MHYSLEHYRLVAVLCASRNSAYHAIEGIEVYDPDRDAWSFPGGMPIVAHPPCRPWSVHLSHFSKAPQKEKELGEWCVHQLRKNGGVLEHPAHSRLFQKCGLPGPNERKGELHTICVWQAWWGYPTRKRTWLCFCGVDVASLAFPFRLLAPGQDAQTMRHMSTKQRSATTPELAKWLVEAARTSRR